MDVGKPGSSIFRRLLVLAICVTLFVLTVHILAPDYTKGLVSHAFNFYNDKGDPLGRQPCTKLNITGFVINQSIPCTICESRSKIEGKWYNFSVKGFRLFAYNAFYDDRSSIQANPTIRIITVGDIYNAALLANMSCILYHSNGTTYVPMRAPIGGGPNYGLERYIYECPIPVGMKPMAVSLQGNATVRSCMPVEYPLKPKKPGDFGVCVPLTFGNVDPYFLIEWMEMQKHLGINFVVFYDYSVGEAAWKVLKHYEKEGFVDLRKTDPIFTYQWTEHVIQTGILLTDCLYRHMYAAKWLIVNDIDEFFRPLKHTTLKELLDYLETNFTFASPTGAPNFMLRNSYFLMEHKPDTNISSHLKLLQYRMRSPLSDHGHRIKTFVNPMSCNNVHNHHCIVPTANYSHRRLNELISPDLGQVLHYRRCLHHVVKCRQDMNNSVLDNYILAYMDDFKSKVEKRIVAIMGELPKNYY